LVFDDPRWYEQHRDTLAVKLRSLPTFKLEATGDEYRLKDDSVANSWTYDLRVFLRPQTIDLEVSSRTKSLYEDFQSLLTWLEHETSVRLIDDDGNMVRLTYD
jgi:hypothetical protein